MRRMDLFILRHGEAGKRSTNPGSDGERTLTSKGRKEVEAVAESFSGLGIKFDSILTSPLNRAHETAEIFSKTLRNKNGIADWEELKPEGSRPEFYKKLSEFKPESNLLVVGHEPYLTNMINDIIDTNGNGYIALKKSGLARVRVTSLSPKIRGELRWLLTPKLLKKLS